MPTYTETLTNQEYVPNVVVRIMGDYFAIRQPDSGLVIPNSNIGTLRSLNLNPTQIDPFNATTSVNSNSVSILDVGSVVTQKFATNPQIFQGELCEIWLGRSFVDMDFSDYLKIPDTYISKVSKQDNSYNFSTKEAKDRLTTGAFNTQAKLGASILPATTVITVQDASCYLLLVCSRSMMNSFHTQESLETTCKTASGVNKVLFQTVMKLVTIYLLQNFCKGTQSRCFCSF